MIKDKYGIFGQIQKDGSVEGGDSVCFTGHWVALTNDPYWHLERFINTFEIDSGLWVRHPHKDSSKFGWASYHNGPYEGVISRDQLTGILHALAVRGHKRAARRFFWQHLKRGLIFTNNTLKNGQDPGLIRLTNPGLKHFFLCIMGQVHTRKAPDITFMETWGMLIRACRFWWAYPLLLIFDLQLLVAAIFTEHFQKLNPNEPKGRDDVLSFVGQMLTAAQVYPTPVSKLACRLTNAHSIMEKLKVYWCDWRAQCGFLDAYRPKVEKYFNGFWHP